MPSRRSRTSQPRLHRSRRRRPRRLLLARSTSLGWAPRRRRAAGPGMWWPVTARSRPPSARPWTPPPWSPTTSSAI
eukprot:1760421-Lingulodinium_polyedra.AAC.1